MGHRGERSEGGLNAGAAAFEFAFVWGTLTAVALLPRSELTGGDWLAFGVLVPVIAVVHLLGAEREKHQKSHLSLAPMFAAVLLLPPHLAAAAIAAAFVPEWLRTRKAWYIELFNTANFVGPAVAARAAFDAVAASGTVVDWSIGALAAIATFVVLQYAALAVMLRLAVGVRAAETVRPDCVLIDAGLLSLGAAAAALWQFEPALVVLTLLPLAVAYRSLAVPALVETNRVEPKTGLFNVRHFEAALAQELGRAARFGRPLAVLMIDVDHLRDVNNAHGHVVGDRVLRMVADSLRSATREYDVVARFGGDEFSVLLPETDLNGALVVAERIRRTVESAASDLVLAATVSVGVAAHRGDGVTAEQLVTLADRAAYRAKFSGRNAVAVAPDGDPVDEAERLLADAAGVG